MQIGMRRFRVAAGTIAFVGVVGTFLTTAAIALLAHALFGFDWYLALLLGTAIAPTDPAVVFSVLGQRELAGRSSTILEGESGANDPVGIALMTALLAAGGLTGRTLGHAAGEFALQMLVGAAVGIGGGLALRWLLRVAPVPAEGLAPLRTMTSALFLFGLATVAHGSGFLAVFAAGIVIGDSDEPLHRRVRSFHASLASLGEIVAFVALGLTVDLGVLGRVNVWVPGLVLGALLAVVVRPLAVGLCLLPVRLARNERAFVLLAGLKGAVPVLLGSFLLAARVPQAPRLYGIVVVVVVLSVVVQGGLVPTAVRRLGLPLRSDDDE
jgi:cell volume regulation protein A